MSHRNARTTFEGRRLIVQRRQNGWKPAHIAAAMGISRKCVGKWLARFEQDGEDGLLERSSRPHSSPNATPAEVEQAVLELRAAERRGRDWIAAELGVPARTVSRVLARHDVPHLADLDPMTGQRIRAPRTSAGKPVTYERKKPGELVHMDVKKLAKIPDGGGWRAQGQTTLNHRSRDRRTPRQGPGMVSGYDFVHSLVDDHSRLAYCEILPDEKGPTCAGFLERAIDYFAAHGITRIERLMTDNAWAYRYSLREVCAAHEIRQKFIRPHCPWQNGKVERLNRTLATEWAYRRVFTSNDERIAALAPWVEYYNNQRRHSALEGQPPISRLQPTS